MLNTAQTIIYLFNETNDINIVLYSYNGYKPPRCRLFTVLVDNLGLQSKAGLPYSGPLFINAQVNRDNPLVTRLIVHETSMVNSTYSCCVFKLEDSKKFNSYQKYLNFPLLYPNFVSYALMKRGSEDGGLASET